MGGATAAAAAPAAPATSTETPPSTEVAAASVLPSLAPSLLSLPEDVLEKICAELLRERRVCIGGTRGPGWLAQLGATCTRARRLINRPPLLPSLLLSAAGGAPSASPATLEELAVSQAVSSLIERGGARVGFRFAGTELDDEIGDESAIPGESTCLYRYMYMCTAPHNPHTDPMHHQPHSSRLSPHHSSPFVTTQCVAIN